MEAIHSLPMMGEGQLTQKVLPDELFQSLLEPIVGALACRMMP